MVTPSWPSELHRIRSLNLLEAFNQLGYQVYLFSLLVHPEERKFVEPVKKMVEGYFLFEYPFSRGIKRVWQNLPFWPFYPWEYLFLKDGKIKQKVAEFAQKVQPDFLYIKRLRSLAFAGQLLNYYPTLLDTTDAMSLFYKNYQQVAGWKEKPIGWHEYWGYRRLEKQIEDNYPNLTWVAASRRDGQYLQEKVGVERVWVWPNVVELRREKQRKKASRKKKLRVVMSGLMNKAINYRPALEVVERIWPQVYHRLPQAELIVAGPNPVAALKKKDGWKGVRVVGYLLDLNVFLSQASLYLAWGTTPAGSRNKILQAAAAGLPIVACEDILKGLKIEKGTIVVVKTVDEAADRVVELLSNPREQEFLRQRGLKWVRKNYSLNSLKRRIKENLEGQNEGK